MKKGEACTTMKTKTLVGKGKWHKNRDMQGPPLSEFDYRPCLASGCNRYFYTDKKHRFCDDHSTPTNYSAGISCSTADGWERMG